MSGSVSVYICLSVCITLRQCLSVCILFCQCVNHSDLLSVRQSMSSSGGIRLEKCLSASKNGLTLSRQTRRRRNSNYILWGGSHIAPDSETDRITNSSDTHSHSLPHFFPKSYPRYSIPLTPPSTISPPPSILPISPNNPKISFRLLHSSFP